MLILYLDHGEAVRARGAALQFALFEFRMDHDVVLEAVKQDLCSERSSRSVESCTMYICWIQGMVRRVRGFIVY